MNKIDRGIYRREDQESTMWISYGFWQVNQRSMYLYIGMTRPIIATQYAIGMTCSYLPSRLLCKGLRPERHGEHVRDLSCQDVNISFLFFEF